MTLAPIWRTRFVAGGAALAAVWLGSNIAMQELTLPLVCVGAIAAIILTIAQPLPIGTLLLGVSLFGYVVGNRGFAQLSVLGNLPLLPAELVLLVAGATLLMRSALHQHLPIRRDAVNLAILFWIAVSSIRLYADLRTFGLMALRDYAMIYYAAFFFLAQDAAQDERSRRFLKNCLQWSCAALLLIYPLFLKLPDLFLSTLTVRGTPLIFFKGDLAGTFMAVGAVLFFVRWETHRSKWSLALSLILVVGTIASNNRASMLALFVGTGLLALAGRWRLALFQGAMAVFAICALVFVAHLRNESWQKTPLGGIYERVVSLTDPMGERTYAEADAIGKGDNNLFRAVWWRAVFDETVANDPIVGLGFGYDLAGRFVREYYPEGDSFSTRSPHNVLLTVFGRTGAVGLGAFLLVAGILIWRTVGMAKRDLTTGALWAGACAILVSACFGVVLEGPMGAVVFWSLLGIANAEVPAPAESEPDSPFSSADPLLRRAEPANQVGRAP